MPSFDDEIEDHGEPMCNLDNDNDNDNGHDVTSTADSFESESNPEEEQEDVGTGSAVKHSHLIPARIPTTRPILPSCALSVLITAILEPTSVIAPLHWPLYNWLYINDQCGYGRGGGYEPGTWIFKGLGRLPTTSHVYHMGSSCDEPNQQMVPFYITS